MKQEQRIWMQASVALMAAAAAAIHVTTLAAHLRTMPQTIAHPS